MLAVARFENRDATTEGWPMRKTTIGAVIALVFALIAAPAAASSSVQHTDILGQGGVGVANEDGAELQRFDDRVQVRFSVATPEPNTYSYPTADMVPPGASHPEIVPGYPEVFTLWAFVFNYPEECTDGACDFDDIGHPDSQGGVYRLDAALGTRGTITMVGTVGVGQAAAAGLPLVNPHGAEVHVAMAPHGMLVSGPEGHLQTRVAVGGVAHWWPAIFVPE
jgi:hypothetical protein